MERKMNKFLSCFGTVALTVVSLLGLFGEGSGTSGEERDKARPRDRCRVIVSTDIGGSDPDDFQSMVHYLLYADVFDTEGLIASPPNPRGTSKDILEVIGAYEKDYPRLRTWSARYPKPDVLRAITRDGARDPAPRDGYSRPTEGSRWIVQQAKKDDPRPLYVLVWGSITDVAQAVHDSPDIKKKLRVYSIGSWNTRQDPLARNYLFKHHPDLWLIEADTTFRGMYVGGSQEGDLGNRTFVTKHVKGHGALGELFVRKKADIKMGDTPSVLYLLHGDPDRPETDHWGGRFRKTDHGPRYWTDDADPKWREGRYPGAKTVNRWREAYLRDWQRRLDRLTRSKGK
jgi:Cellulose-binding Sde182, nucleoside hydrolase-like domain